MIALFLGKVNRLVLRPASRGGPFQGALPFAGRIFYWCFLVNFHFVFAAFWFWVKRPQPSFGFQSQTME
jgi:hypothetical protein